MNKIIKITGRAIPLPGDDIDTDRIIPARFMKCVSFDGLGEYAFYDERYDGKGAEKEHPLNQEVFNEGEILIVGKNFGCGSSREHAPQALMRWGIKALIGESFAEIFAGNCTAMGIPTVLAMHEQIQLLTQAIQSNTNLNVDIDLESLKVTAGELCLDIRMSESFRQALTMGLWDTTSLLLSNVVAVKDKASQLKYISNFA